MPRLLSLLEVLGLGLPTLTALALSAPGCNSDDASGDTSSLDGDATADAELGDTRETEDDSAAPDAPDTQVSDLGPDTPDAPDADDAESEIDAPDTADAPDVTDAADSLDTADVPDVPEVIDPNADSDRDGIKDSDERLDGTDPFDARSARAWHPEVTGHPRLFVNPASQALIKSRAEATTGRAKVLWDRVLSLANRAVPDHPMSAGFDTSIPPQQAQVIAASALVAFAQTDLGMANKVLTALAAPFPDPTPLNQRSAFNAGDHYDLLEAEALDGMCIAWDLVAGLEGVDADQVQAARARLVERIDYFRKLCMQTGGCTSLLRGEPNNHAMKALSALGVCAIAIPDRPEAASDFNEALSAMQFLAHDKQGHVEGGWAESWNYLSYSGETHLGFLYAVHHLTPDATPDGLWKVKAKGWVTTLNPANGTVVDVLDPGADPLWHAVYRGALVAALPSGQTTTVDDANLSGLHGGLLAALFDDPRFLWNWDLPRIGMHTGRQLVATFLALADDPERAALAPDWSPEIFWPDAGFSVMRSDFSADASYFHMQHEKDRMRTGGGAHEHADSLSFMLGFRGELLAVDPGYIDFTNHGKVKYGKDHNIILVDGQGPEFFLDGLVEVAPNSDAFLHAHEVSPPFATLIASTKYNSAELRRRVVRVSGDPEIYVVADRMTGSLAFIPRTYTFQLNGLASEEIGQTSFAMTTPGTGVLATWARPRAVLDAALMSTAGNATAASRLEESSLASGRHRCLTLESSMAADAGFLTVLVPRAADAAESTRLAEKLSGVSVITVTAPSGAKTRAYLNPGTSAVSVTSLAAAPNNTISIAPGLTIEIVQGETRTVRTWTMDTPPIPDPSPFLPE